MKILLSLFLSIFPCLLSLTSVPAHAELSGAVVGRGARISLEPTLSFEAAASWYTHQLQWSSVRLNAKLGRGLISYFDVAKIHASDLPAVGNARLSFSGIGYGGGVIVTLLDPFTKLDLAFKASFHSAKINHSSGASASSTMALSQSQWSTDFIVSPIDPIFENGVSWYATAGYVATSANVNASDKAAPVAYRRKAGIALGMGVTRPVSRGAVYAGLAWLSGDPLAGVGMRYWF